MAGRRVEIDAGEPTDFDTIFHEAGRNVVFAEIGEADTRLAVAEGAGNVNHCADIGSAGDGTEKKGSSCSRQKGLQRGDIVTSGLRVGGFAEMPHLCIRP